jgi:hypothetical protein
VVGQPELGIKVVSVRQGPEGLHRDMETGDLLPAETVFADTSWLESVYEPIVGSGIFFFFRCPVYCLLTYVGF